MLAVFEDMGALGLFEQCTTHANRLGKMGEVAVEAPGEGEQQSLCGRRRKDGEEVGQRVCTPTECKRRRLCVPCMHHYYCLINKLMTIGL